jgi:hypothetical protein
MTKDEGRMTKECQMTNDEDRREPRRGFGFRGSSVAVAQGWFVTQASFVIWASAFLRHWAFVIRH